MITCGVGGHCIDKYFVSISSGGYQRGRSVRFMSRVLPRLFTDDVHVNCVRIVCLLETTLATIVTLFCPQP